MPLLLFFFVALAIVGTLLFRYQQLVAGAREGARYAGLTQSDVASTRSITLTAIGASTFSSGPTVAVRAWPAGATGWSGALGDADRPCNQLVPGTSRVRVDVSASVAVRAPIVGRLLAARPVQMRASGVFRCE